MIPSIEQQLKDLALKNFPQEACAFVTEFEVFEVKNASLQEDSFLMNPTCVAEFLSKFVDQGSLPKFWIWHSHVKKKFSWFDLRTPSEEDIELFNKFKIPLLISGFDGETYLPSVEFPAKVDMESSLLNRPYICGIFDCGVLTRDYFARKLGITLQYEFKPSYLHLRNWEQAVVDFLEYNCFEEQKNRYPIPFDLLIIPFFNIANAHVIVLDETGTHFLHQDTKSRLVHIEEFIHLDCKLYRLNIEKFKEKFQ